MASFVKFEVLSEHVAEKVHDFGSDTLKVLLTNVAPVAASDSVAADLTEITAGNGYVAGGSDATNATSRSGATTSVTGTDIVITASGGTIGPFRYAVLYNDTPTSPADPLIGYWDYGSAVTLADGEPLTIDFGSSLFTIA